MSRRFTLSACLRNRSGSYLGFLRALAGMPYLKGDSSEGQGTPSLNGVTFYRVGAVKDTSCVGVVKCLISLREGEPLARVPAVADCVDLIHIGGDGATVDEVARHFAKQADGRSFDLAAPAAPRSRDEFDAFRASESARACPDMHRCPLTIAKIAFRNIVTRLGDDAGPGSLQHRVPRLLSFTHRVRSGDQERGGLGDQQQETLATVRDRPERRGGLEMAFDTSWAPGELYLCLASLYGLFTPDGGELPKAGLAIVDGSTALCQNGKHAFDVVVGHIFRTIDERGSKDPDPLTRRRDLVEEHKSGSTPVRYLILHPFGAEMVTYARLLWREWGHFRRHTWVLAILEHTDAKQQFWCILRVSDRKRLRKESREQVKPGVDPGKRREALVAILLKEAAVATGALHPQAATRMTAAMREGLNSDSESLAVVAREWLQRGLASVKRIEWLRVAPPRGQP